MHHTNDGLATVSADYAFGERSGGYTVTPASRHTLSPALQASIHEEAVNALKDGQPSSANPYKKDTPAYLQWEHSYDEFAEAQGT